MDAQNTATTCDLEIEVCPPGVTNLNDQSPITSSMDCQPCESVISNSQTSYSKDHSPFACRRCYESFNNNFPNVDAHFQTFLEFLHGSDRQLQACNLCNTTFNNITDLKCHLQSHSQLSCEQCKQSFREEDFPRHECCDISEQAQSSSSSKKTRYLQKKFPQMNHHVNETGSPDPPIQIGNCFSFKSTNISPFNDLNSPHLDDAIHKNIHQRTQQQATSSQHTLEGLSLRHPMTTFESTDSSGSDTFSQDIENQSSKSLSNDESASSESNTDSQSLSCPPKELRMASSMPPFTIYSTTLSRVIESSLEGFACKDLPAKQSEHNLHPAKPFKHRVHKRRKRCGDCSGCKRVENCGFCGPCINLNSRRICKNRRCVFLATTQRQQISQNNKIQDCPPSTKILKHNYISGLQMHYETQVSSSHSNHIQPSSHSTFSNNSASGYGIKISSVFEMSKVGLNSKESSSDYDSSNISVPSSSGYADNSQSFAPSIQIEENIHFSNLNEDFQLQQEEPQISTSVNFDEGEDYCDISPLEQDASNVQSVPHKVPSNKERECSKCEKSFSSIYNLWRHIKTFHKGMKLYSCQLCDKKFPFIAWLDRHMKSHTVSKFGCSHCIFKFKSTHELKKHVSRFHKQKEHKLFKKSASAGDKISSSQSLSKTKKSCNKPSSKISTTINKKHACEICRKCFSSSSSTSRHFRSELHLQQARIVLASKRGRKTKNEKKFECGVCGGMLSSQRGVHRHALALHSNVKSPKKKVSPVRQKSVPTVAVRQKFTCTRCFMVFRDKNCRNRHVRLHRQYNK